MWKCPICHRSFSKVNQPHTCSLNPQTVDDYIALQPKESQSLLQTVREAIHEVILMQRKPYRGKCQPLMEKTNIIHFALFKHHLGIYPGDQAIIYFQNLLKPYKTSKGAIQFQLNEPIPLSLIQTIAKWCFDAQQ
jgi:uncharacterized protein YdhG (YjbR/CyaY superfamily)